MSDLHVTLIPCRSVRVRGGLITISGVSNVISTDGSFPYQVKKLAVYVRLKGLRPSGVLSISLAAPTGKRFKGDKQLVPPFDISGVGETWFDTHWLALPEAGRYTLSLELDGRRVAETAVVVLE